jgi:hypothetical protein
MSYDATDSVLPRCTRLESLTLHNNCPPAASLGLSQLHTLRGLSFAVVPAATIVAALPRLHTLHINNVRADFSVAAFFDELLPRLRSFHLQGKWPKAGENETEMTDAMPPLPLLDDLKWAGWSVHVPRQLMGARPSTLNTSDVDLLKWLQAADGAGADSAVSVVASPLARVRALTLRLGQTPPPRRRSWRGCCARRPSSGS